MRLPLSYPSPQFLPFNRTCLDRRFRFSSPGQDPGGAGVWLLLQDDRLLVAGEQGCPKLPDADAGFVRPLFVGLWDGQPCRLVKLSGEDEIPAGLHAESLTASEPQLPIDLLSLGGLARMILHWEEHSRHCPVCGASLSRCAAEWGKTCAACRSRFFPHVAPCAIVLVRRPGEVLLIRKPEYAPDRYGLVAGFIEFGECLEEAAVREVLEETGVMISNLRYVGSQCWPFPSQLMCGFVADYAGGEIAIDTRELVDARWFSRDALPVLPPKRSIARYLLDTELVAV